MSDGTAPVSLADDPLADLANEPLTIEVDDEGSPIDSGAEGTKTETAAEPSEHGDEDEIDLSVDNPDSDEAGKAEGDESKPEPEKQPDADKPGKKLSGSARARAKIDALEAEIRELKAAGMKPADEVAAARAAFVEAEAGKEPQEADYENFLDYDRAKTVYEIEKRAAEREFNRTQRDSAKQTEAKEAEAAAARNEHVQELLREHHARLDDLEKAIPGAKATIAKAEGKLHADAHVAELLLESDKSGLLNLYFAKNPEKLAELNGMPPRAAAKEFGRLESRVHLPKPKTETTAPKPVPPPKGAASPPSSDAELDAWLAKNYG